MHRQNQVLHHTRTTDACCTTDSVLINMPQILPLNFVKEAIIQGHKLSRPFWKGSLEDICLLPLLDQGNSVSHFAEEGKSCQMVIEFGCFSPSLSTHFVSLGIYLNTSQCFRVKHLSAIEYLQVFYGSICKV